MCCSNTYFLFVRVEITYIIDQTIDKQFIFGYLLMSLINTDIRININSLIVSVSKVLVK